MHTPDVHDVDDGQALLQEPQCSASLDRSTQVPTSPLPTLQVVCLAGHAQAPAEQRAPRGHWFPHPPQFASSVCRSTSELRQFSLSTKE